MVRSALAIQHGGDVQYTSSPWRIRRIRRHSVMLPTTTHTIAGGPVDTDGSMQQGLLEQSLRNTSDYLVGTVEP